MNHDTGIYVKHATTGTTRWQFTFVPEHQEAIREMFQHYGDKTFVVLVCAKLGVCALTYGEYAAALGENFRAQRGLVVQRPSGGGFRVHGTEGRVRRVVPLSDFPECLF